MQHLLQVNVALNTFITLHLLLDRRRNTPSRSQASPDAISKLARSTLSNLSLVWAAQVSFAACTLLYYLNGSLRAGFAGQAVGHLVAVLAAISTLCTIISDMPHCDHLRAIKGSADDPGTWMGTRSFVAEGRATIDPPRVEVVVMPPMEGASGGEGYEINGGVEKVGGLGLQRDTSSVSALSVGTTELLLNESALETCVARHLRPRVRPKVGSVSFGSAEQDVVRPAE